MRRYRVSCYDPNDERLADLTIEAPDKAVAEMMVLAQLHGASTRLADRIDKLVVRPEQETAETDLALGDGVKLTANETIGPNEPSSARPPWADETHISYPPTLAHFAP